MYSLWTAALSLSPLFKSNKVASSEASIPLLSIDFAVVALYTCDSSSRNWFLIKFSRHLVHKINKFIWWHNDKFRDCHWVLLSKCIQTLLDLFSHDSNSPIVCVVLALDSWNYCSGEQAQQPNIRKIPKSSLYSWTMYITEKNKVLPPYVNSPCHKVAHAGNSTSS